MSVVNLTNRWSAAFESFSRKIHSGLINTTSEDAAHLYELMLVQQKPAFCERFGLFQSNMAIKRWKQCFERLSFDSCGKESAGDRSAASNIWLVHKNLELLWMNTERCRIRRSRLPGKVGRCTWGRNNYWLIALASLEIYPDKSKFLSVLRCWIPSWITAFKVLEEAPFRGSIVESTKIQLFLMYRYSKWGLLLEQLHKLNRVHKSVVQKRILEDIVCYLLCLGVSRSIPHKILNHSLSSYNRDLGAVMRRQVTPKDLVRIPSQFSFLVVLLHLSRQHRTSRGLQGSNFQACFEYFARKSLTPYHDLALKHCLFYKELPWYLALRFSSPNLLEALRQRAVKEKIVSFPRYHRLGGKRATLETPRIPYLQCIQGNWLNAMLVQQNCNR